MDDKIDDKESAEYQWAKYVGPKKVEDFMWNSASHGPEWSEKEIKEAVQGLVENIKRIKKHAETMGRPEEHLKDFVPKKTKKKILEYIKKHI